MDRSTDRSVDRSTGEQGQQQHHRWALVTEVGSLGTQGKQALTALAIFRTF